MPATAKQYNSASKNSPLFHNGYKLSFEIQAELWQILQLDLEVPTRVLQALLFPNTEQATVTVRQLNRVRKKWRVSRKRGRPFSKIESGHKPAEVIQFKPIVSAIGLQIFSIWLELQPMWETIAGELSEQIASYRQAHPAAAVHKAVRNAAIADFYFLITNANCRHNHQPETNLGLCLWAP